MHNAVRKSATLTWMSISAYLCLVFAYIYVAELQIRSLLACTSIYIHCTQSLVFVLISIEYLGMNLE